MAHKKRFTWQTVSKPCFQRHFNRHDCISQVIVAGISARINQQLRQRMINI